MQCTAFINIIILTGGANGVFSSSSSFSLDGSSTSICLVPVCSVVVAANSKSKSSGEIGMRVGEGDEGGSIGGRGGIVVARSIDDSSVVVHSVVGTVVVVGWVESTVEGEGVFLSVVEWTMNRDASGTTTVGTRYNEEYSLSNQIKKISEPSIMINF